MNKIAFAASLLCLSLSTAAQAQSSVTIFALIDANISNYSPGSKVGGGDLTLMNDGTTNGLNGSRWGIRGVEDLGDGMKASILLESGVIVDTGSAGQGGRSFGRQAFVALSTPRAGEVRLGRQYILSDSVVGQGNPFGNALVNNPTTSVTNMGRNLPMFLNAPRADNVLQYQTPSFGGVTLAAQLAPGEGTADRFHGVRATYAAGPLYAGLSYEWGKSRATGDSTNKSLSISANYNLGVAKLLGGIQRNSDLATGSGNGAAVGVSNLVVTGATGFTMDEANGWTLGAEIPVGQALVIGPNYTRMTYANAAGASASLGKFALTGRYGLSKNTFLYAGASLATGDLKDYISQKRVIQAGLRTAF